MILFIAFGFVHVGSVYRGSSQLLAAVCDEVLTIRQAGDSATLRWNILHLPSDPETVLSDGCS